MTSQALILPDTPPQRLAGDLAIWFFIGAELVAFAAFFGAYAFTRASHVAEFNLAQQGLNRDAGAVNTLLLLTASAFVVRAVQGALAGRARADAVWLLAAIVCGIGFLGVKGVEYAAAFDQGISLSSINQTLAIALGGSYINDFIDRGRVKKVYIQGDASSRMSPEDLNKWRVGVDKGTVNEGVLRDKFPGAKVIAYDDTPFAFTALRNGNVQAITQDGPKLIGLLANVPDKDKYEVPPFTISNDLIGVGVPKGETALTEVVKQTLLELESKGQAQKIYDTWFGPDTKTPLTRLYKIGDKS